MIQFNRTRREDAGLRWLIGLTEQAAAGPGQSSSEKLNTIRL